MYSSNATMTLFDHVIKVLSYLVIGLDDLVGSLIPLPFLSL